MAGVIKREYGFLFSVGAEQELARLCPDGDLGRLREMLARPDGEALRFGMELICLLSRWYEKARKLEDPAHEERPLTVEELELLPISAYKELQAEAMAAMLRDSAQTVEAEPGKKAKAPRSS